MAVKLSPDSYVPRLVRRCCRFINLLFRARIAGCLQNIQELGFDSPRVQFRQIKGSLWEIKIKTARSVYRFFYVCIQQDIIVLLHAYKKQSQKAPKHEIELAEKRMMEVFNNKSTYLLNRKTLVSRHWFLLIDLGDIHASFWLRSSFNASTIFGYSTREAQKCRRQFKSDFF
ncbi:type II toxin-antitoxin system RelE/ParE family toxin [Legionella dresdenensis]|uniref:Type II toxin-antitoxin system RelE/ParE family toxin n=1 Tax=Legionella dresdenensis TaxID=450200 RepID=A0ABV8CEL9_9GAMM